LAEYIDKFHTKLADDNEPIYVRNIMIITSRIKSSFKMMKEFNLNISKKIMYNPLIDPGFKTEYGFEAAKRFQETNI